MEEPVVNRLADPLDEAIRADVERLCAAGDRDLGTARNRDATDYVLGRMHRLGLQTEALELEVPEWRFGAAAVTAGSLELAMHVGPYSPACDGKGPLIVIETPDEIARVVPGSVLLLHGEIAAEQFTPRDYPFYSNPAHAEVLDALEAARPLAVIAATSKSAMTGAMSPFPLIEETRFSVPSAYLSVEAGGRLVERTGEVVSVTIESEVLPSTGVQPIGRLAGSGPGRIIVSAHIDSKPETPGAIDNAAGVAVLLALAELLGGSALPESAPTIEFVPFNGEDHVLAPGEMAWLARNADLSDVLLAVNVDAPGLPGKPSAYSLYGVDKATSAAARDVAENTGSVAEGPQWPASDHMIFAMAGVPAIAVTSGDFTAASQGYSHTPADVPAILDYELLAGTARFIAELVTRAATNTSVAP